MIRPELTQLFKYRVVNDNSIKSLQKDIVWVSKPKDFNDPFEYTFHVEPNLTYAQSRKMNSSITRSNYKQEQIGLIEKLKTEFDVGGIYCLSESNKIGLMWSHYADSHRGFCVWYKRSDDNVLGSDKCFPVDYTTFPEFTLDWFFNTIHTKEENQLKMLFSKIVLNKDPNWKYENEWRILYTQSNQLIKVDFPIQSITFGLRMPDDKKEEIRQALSGKQIEYYQAIKANRSYDLEIEKLP